MKRATLDDFVSSGESKSGTDDATGPSDASTSTVADGTDGENDNRSETESTLDQPTPTFAAGRERPCARCGVRTVRRWCVDEEFVCPSCREW